MTGPHAPDGDGTNGHDPAKPGLPIAPSPQRISGMRVPDGWTLPGKPADLDGIAEDAWRQTGFTCGDELRLVAANLDLQARLAETGYTASARSMTMAGYAGLWSRAFSATSRCWCIEGPIDVVWSDDLVDRSSPQRLLGGQR